MAEAGVAAAAATGGESARQEIGEHPREPSDTAAGSDSEERALLRHDSGIDPDEKPRRRSSSVWRRRHGGRRLSNTATGNTGGSTAATGGSTGNISDSGVFSVCGSQYYEVDPLININESQEEFGELEDDSPNTEIESKNDSSAAHVIAHSPTTTLQLPLPTTVERPLTPVQLPLSVTDSRLHSPITMTAVQLPSPTTSPSGPLSPMATTRSPSPATAVGPPSSTTAVQSPSSTTAVRRPTSMTAIQSKSPVNRLSGISISSNSSYDNLLTSLSSTDSQVHSFNERQTFSSPKPEEAQQEHRDEVLVCGYGNLAADNSLSSSCDSVSDVSPLTVELPLACSTPKHNTGMPERDEHNSQPP